MLVMLYISNQSSHTAHVVLAADDDACAPAHDVDNDRKSDRNEPLTYPTFKISDVKLA